jgi:hypothetical protein
MGRLRRERADQRGQREQGGPDQEHLALPRPVAEPAPDDEQRGERDRVAVEHPAQAGQAGPADVGSDAGQRDVDDEQVQIGHTDRRHHDREDRGVSGRSRPV